MYPENGSTTEETRAYTKEDRITDTTGERVFSGKVELEGEEDCYFFTTEVEGIYRFDTDLSSGGSVRMEICGENGKLLDSGKNKMTVTLEADKTYLFNIAYENGPCEYTVMVGVPNSIKEISGDGPIYGSITYKNQEDRYLYTVPVSGTYRFDTDLSAGGEVIVNLYGENGNYIASNWNNLTRDLESGKIYILSIEYKNGVCDYIVNIGVPREVIDIDESDVIVGSITYKRQKDRYRYTAPVDGTYYFETDLSAGGEVMVNLHGENGNYIASARNNLSRKLEAGKTYILSIEYQKGSCDYEVYITTP